MCPAEAGHLGTVKTVLEADPSAINEPNNKGVTPIMFAAAAGHLDVLRYLYTSGANLTALDNTGSSPWLFAARHGKVDVMRYILTLCGRDHLDMAQAAKGALHCKYLF